MIDMLMADEYDNVVISAQNIRCDLQIFRQLSFFSPPIVKYKQRISTGDGKTAVIIVGNNI